MKLVYKRNSIQKLIFPILLFAAGLLHGQSQIGSTLLGVEAYDGTGDVVAINGSGDKIIFSSRFVEQGSFERAGEVKVYELQNDNWLQLGTTLKGTETREELGTSVDINESGTRIAVSSKNGVRVYDLENGDWKLNYNYPTFPDFDETTGGSGRVRFANNGKILVATKGRFETGNVVVYEETNGSWSKKGNSIFTDSEISTIAVSKDGNRLAIPDEFMVTFSNGLGYYSNLRVYDFESNNWVKSYEIVVSDSADIASSDTRSVSLSEGFDFSADGNRLLIITSNDELVDGQGFLRTFDFENNTWNENIPTQEISIDNPFGTTLRLSDDGNIAVIGVTDDVWSEQPNYVQVLQFDNQSWKEIGSRFTGSQSDEYANNFVDITSNGERIIWGGKMNTPTDSLGTIKIYNYDSVLPVNENSLSQNAIMIYPNPSTDFIYIDYASETSYNVNLTNINGQILKTIRDISGEIQIAINDLKNGIYFLTVYIDDLKNSVTKKILKVVD